MDFIERIIPLSAVAYLYYLSEPLPCFRRMLNFIVFFSIYAFIYLLLTTFFSQLNPQLEISGFFCTIISVFVATLFSGILISASRDSYIEENLINRLSGMDMPEIRRIFGEADGISKDGLSANISSIPKDRRERILREMERAKESKATGS